MFFLFHFPLPWNKILQQHCVGWLSAIRLQRDICLYTMGSSFPKHTTHVCSLDNLLSFCPCCKSWKILTFKQRLPSLWKHWVPYSDFISCVLLLSFTTGGSPSALVKQCWVAFQLPWWGACDWLQCCEGLGVRLSLTVQWFFVKWDSK